MFHGMVQNKPLEDLLHSIVEGAVEAKSKFICAALPGHLWGPMSSDKGPRTKKACMLHGRVQDKSLDCFAASCREQWRPRRSSFAQPCSTTLGARCRETKNLRR